MTNIGHASLLDPGLDYTSAAGCLPAGTAGASTLTSTGTRITAAAAAFDKDMKGYFIFAAGQVQRIKDVFNDGLTVETERAFSPALAADTWNMITVSECFIEMSISNVGGVDGTISTARDGVKTFVAGATVTWKGGNGVSPVCFNASGTIYQISTSK